MWAVNEAAEELGQDDDVVGERRQRREAERFGVTSSARRPVRGRAFWAWRPRLTKVVHEYAQAATANGGPARGRDHGAEGAFRSASGRPPEAA
jgi:hypothetical protein